MMAIVAHSPNRADFRDSAYCGLTPIYTKNERNQSNGFVSIFPYIYTVRNSFFQKTKSSISIFCTITTGTFLYVAHALESNFM